MARSDYRFFFPLRVRYAEIDGQGIVFNAHYLTYFDTAAYEYLRWLPFDFLAHADRSGQDFHTVRAEIDFKRSCRFDDELEIAVRVDRMGRSSLIFDMAVYRKQEEDERVSGRIVWVNADRVHERSAPLPADLRERISDREPGLKADASSMSADRFEGSA